MGGGGGRKWGGRGGRKWVGVREAECSPSAQT